MTARRSLIALLLAWFLAAPAALAQAQATAAAPVRVALSTVEGRVVVELYPDKAPITVANFLRYVDRKLYDGASFYRASRPAGATGDDYGLVQGGLRDHPQRKLAPIAHESTLETGLSHTDGAVSLGRFAPGTATSDFFVIVGDQTYLDADPAQGGDNQGFAVFGRVVEGMDVIRKILVMPVDAQAGEGAMKGEILRRPVVITTARRLMEP